MLPGRSWSYANGVSTAKQMFIVGGLLEGPQLTRQGAFILEIIFVTQNKF